MKLKFSDFKNAIPITFITFIAVTMQWNVQPVDAPESVMYGFPFPYSCNAWHTSMARQYFVLEFFADIFCYFGFWIFIFYLLRKVGVDMIRRRFVNYSINIFAAILIILSISLFFMFENIYKVSRDFDFTIQKTHVKFF